MHDLTAWVWDEADIHVFAQRHAGDFDDVVEQGGAAIAVEGTLKAQAKDVFEGSVRFGQGERAKEAVAILLGLLEADGRDFAGGGMHLVVVIAFEFFLQHRAGILQGGDVIQGASAHDAVLQPAVRALDLAFCLWGEGMGDFDAQEAHHLLPLGLDLVGLQDVFTPNAVPALDEAEKTLRLST